jgi:hypothetical protein
VTLLPSPSREAQPNPCNLVPKAQTKFETMIGRTSNAG